MTVGKIRKLFFAVIMLIPGFLKLYAAPYEAEKLDLLQPDGSRVDVLVWGDEYYQHIESPEGYTLVKDPLTKWICYAELDADENEYLSTGLTYENSEMKHSAKKYGKQGPSKKSIKIKKEKIRKKRDKNRKLLGDPSLDILPEEGEGTAPPLQAAPPPAVTRTGSYFGLTLLIDFPDAPATMPQADIEAFCNQIGYTGYTNYGSIRDYFRAASEDLMDYTNHVTAYYTAKNNKAYYTDETISFGTRARELVVEALKDLDAKGFNFASLSTESGRILAINAMYAGSVDNAWSKGLWAHAGTIPTGGFTADGVSARRYQICSIGTNLSIRTFVHENGHLLMQWRDLYDYGSESSGVGNFCVMAAGANNKRPVMPNPYFRQLSGWETLTQVNALTNSVFTRDANKNETVRYGNPANIHESFFLDVRYKSGWNYYYPGSGLVIWHVEGNTGNNDNEQMTCEQHYLVSVEQSDGLNHLETKSNSGAASDLWTSAKTLGFSDFTTPDSGWWCHGSSGLFVSEISAAGNTMTYRIGTGGMSPTFTATVSPVVSPTFTKTASATHTEGTPPPSPTNTIYLTATLTCSRTATLTRTRTRTPTFTRTVTATATQVPPGYAELQFENACEFDGVAETVRAGYTGTGYVNLTNETGSSIVFYLDAQAAGQVELIIRYSNGSVNYRDMSVMVNGAAQPDIIFSPTGAWTTWSAASVSVSLDAGRNEIILISATEEGGPHLDRLSYTSLFVTAAPCIAPSATVTPTGTLTPVFSGTNTALPSSTYTWTNTIPPTSTVSASPINSHTITQTSTATPSGTSSMTPSASITATYTATVENTSTAGSTATPSVTKTATLTLALTITLTETAVPTATPTPVVEETIRILSMLLYGNPYKAGQEPLYVSFDMTGTAESVTAAVYTSSFRKVIETTQSGPYMGQTILALQPKLFEGLANGVYYIVITGEGNKGRAKSKILPFIILRQ